MKIRILSLALATYGLTGCAGLTGGVIMGADAAGIYATKPAQPPPADTADQINAHQSWCYSTLGNTECYAHPQDVPPERLVNVDPQNAYPVDLAAYHQALTAPPPPTVVVVTTNADTTIVVQPAAAPIAPPPIVTPVVPTVVAPPPASDVVNTATVKPKKPHTKKTGKNKPVAPAQTTATVPQPAAEPTPLLPEAPDTELKGEIENDNASSPPSSMTAP